MSFAIHCTLSLLLVLAMLVVSSLLGERHRGAATLQPYESGMIPTGNARARISSQYYLIALFFVLFDVEVAFLFPWALVARDAGRDGLIGAAGFIGLLLLVLLYLWRSGALVVGER